MKAALGIDVGGTKIRAGVVREDGSILQIMELRTEAEKGGSHVVDQLLSIIQSLPHDAICGIGVGTAGQVGLDGTILSATSTFADWSGVELEKVISSKSKLPVKVVNDVQAMALGELHYGEGLGLKNFLCLALGTGVGGAIVCEGKLYRGANGAAGEMGHLIIRANGKLCPCGKKGCLEAYVSGTALSQRYSEIIGVQSAAYDLFKDARLNKYVAKQLVDEFISDLLCGLSSLGDIFNPQKIILGGGLAESLVDYMPMITSKLKDELSSAAALPIHLSISQLGGNAMILGAASLII
ncbi:MAG: ROK family protein [Paenibacillaceae bacterium]